jgi:beta-N-acetylhexosaminidase
VTASTIDSIRRWHAGSVILDGNSSLGIARTHTITRRLQSLAPARVKLFIATDQEGGEVQRLRGAGFASIPSAVAQGAQSPEEIRSEWGRWGDQLKAAGVNLNLAPVLDTVPHGDRDNPPIGELQREYGRTPQHVASHGVAAARGLADAGIAATAKHFPGLGRVTGNTDTTSGVTDTVTTRHDPYLQPFRSAVQAHVPFVMVSTADYARIDQGTPAIFSKTIISGMLRHDLGFHGVIVTDDIGAAAQVASVPAGMRAIRFVQAGGTMVLTVVPSTVATMASALIQRASRDATFRKLVDAAALVVLKAKQAHGLLH